LNQGELVGVWWSWKLVRSETSRQRIVLSGPSRSLSTNGFIISQLIYKTNIGLAARTCYTMSMLAEMS